VKHARKSGGVTTAFLLRAVAFLVGRAGITAEATMQQVGLSE